MDGILNTVGHHPDDLATTVGRPRIPDALLAPEALDDLLDDTWHVDTLEAIPRTQQDKDGNEVNVKDTVLTAKRQKPRASPSAPD